MKYKAGDKKEYDGRTFFYCDSPFHRNCMRWHTHPTDKCRTRERWLKKKQDGNLEIKDEALVIVSEENELNTSAAPNSTNSGSTSSTASSNPSDIQALLASAMNLVQDNGVPRDHIVDAINHISDS